MAEDLDHAVECRRRHRIRNAARRRRSALRVYATRFTLGISGIVTTFDAASGKQIWQRPHDPVEPLYHTAMSPLVIGNLMILHVGGHDNGALTAFAQAPSDGAGTVMVRRTDHPCCSISQARHRS